MSINRLYIFSRYDINNNNNYILLVSDITHTYFVQNKMGHGKVPQKDHCFW